MKFLKKGLTTILEKPSRLFNSNESIRNRVYDSYVNEHLIGIHPLERSDFVF